MPPTDPMAADPSMASAVGPGAPPPGPPPAPAGPQSAPAPKSITIKMADNGGFIVSTDATEFGSKPSESVFQSIDEALMSVAEAFGAGMAPPPGAEGMMPPEEGITMDSYESPEAQQMPAFAAGPGEPA